MKTGKRIFEHLVEKPGTSKKWLFFPLSLVFHGCLIAVVVLGPLMNADNQLPEIKMINVFLASPVPPPPPPPPPPKGSSRLGKKSDKPKPGEQKRPVNTGRLVQPIEIPDEIEEEGLGIGLDVGVPGGVEGGVVGGMEGGVLGSSLLGTDQDFDSHITPISIQQPKLIRRIEPDYPIAAIRSQIQGIVILEAVTDIYGKVVKVNIINGHALLNSAAVQAVRQWIYEPYIVCGVPKPVTFIVKINFSLRR